MSRSLGLAVNRSSYVSSINMVVVPPAAVIVTENLPPGTSTVCKRGQTRESASSYTWIKCLLLLPLGIIPDINPFSADAD
ncbi:hypothetical protein SK128_010555 [Halocaridina rubra]|uniref:Uncharacterized protein n=1 Tax=Halocaridina rubra TaxID=373956 RepID=A0AAN9ADL2_HALRR